jgi:hypothetical protein
MDPQKQLDNPIITTMNHQKTQLRQPIYKGHESTDNS